MSLQIKNDCPSSIAIFKLEAVFIYSNENIITGIAAINGATIHLVKSVMIHCCPVWCAWFIYGPNGELNEDMATLSLPHLNVLKGGANICHFLRMQYCFWFTVWTWGWGRVVAMVRSFCLAPRITLTPQVEENSSCFIATTKCSHSNYHCRNQRNDHWVGEYSQTAHCDLDLS